MRGLLLVYGAFTIAAAQQQALVHTVVAIWIPLWTTLKLQERDGSVFQHQTVTVDEVAPKSCSNFFNFKSYFRGELPTGHLDEGTSDTVDSDMKRAMDRLEAIAAYAAQQKRAQGQVPNIDIDVMGV